MPQDPNVVAKIVATLNDYREGEIARIDNARVTRWIGQFPAAMQAVVLSETAHLLGKFYIPKTAVDDFIENKVLISRKLTGGDPKAFWRDASVLDIQGRSESQKRMNARLFAAIKGKLGIDKAPNGATPTGRYIYMDDVLYSGTQVRTGLTNWMNKHDVRNAHVEVIVFGNHTRGFWFTDKKLKEVADPRSVKVRFWSMEEARLNDWRKDGEEAICAVLHPLRPASDPSIAAWLKRSPDDAKHAEKSWRKADAANPNFSSPSARNALEQSLLAKGAYICTLPARWDEHMHPLGFNILHGPGFGTFAMTFQNCPNNAPLALWWGTGDGNSTLGKWFPLLPRRTRTNEARD